MNDTPARRSASRRGATGRKAPCYTPSPSLNFTPEMVAHSGARCITEDLRRSGFLIVPGLGAWLEKLSPINRPEAWAALLDAHTISIIGDHPAQKSHFTLNDEGGIDLPGEASVGVAVKKKKSHLTLVEGGDSIASDPLLPRSVQAFLSDAFAFQRAMRTYFDDVMPPTKLPTRVQSRIFDYKPHDLWDEPEPAMRQHVDGTVITVVVAETADRALRCRVGKRWEIVGRPDGKPFAVAFAGSAAMHDFDLLPIPHLVLPCNERRISIATRLAPDLGSGTLEQAERRLAQWQLADRL